MEALIPVATLGGPTMFARIGIMRALSRNVVREFNPDRKGTHWGRRKLKRDEYPPGSPAEWLAEGHVTCSIRCLNGHCKHTVDVRLDPLPQDRPWSRVGPQPDLHRMRRA